MFLRSLAGNIYPLLHLASHFIRLGFLGVRVVVGRFTSEFLVRVLHVPCHDTIRFYRQLLGPLIPDFEAVLITAMGRDVGEYGK